VKERRNRNSTQRVNDENALDGGSKKKATMSHLVAVFIFDPHVVPKLFYSTILHHLHDILRRKTGRQSASQ